MEKLKDKIKRIRLEKKLNQIDLSKAAGISRVAYSYFENGTTDKLSLDSAIGIAKALGVSFNELFDIPDSSDHYKKKIEELEKELYYYQDIQRKMFEEYRERKKIDTMALHYKRLVMYTVELFELLDFEFFEKYHLQLSLQLKKIETYSSDSVHLFLSNKEFDKMEDIENYLLPFLDVEKYKTSTVLNDLILAHSGSEKWTRESLVQRVVDAKKRLE